MDVGIADAVGGGNLWALRWVEYYRKKTENFSCIWSNPSQTFKMEVAQCSGFDDLWKENAGLVMSVLSEMIFPDLNLEGGL